MHRVEDKKEKAIPPPSLFTLQASPSLHACRKGEPLTAPVSHTQALDKDVCCHPLP